MLLMAPLTQPFTVRTALETIAAIGTVGSLFFYFLSALSMASFISVRKKDRRKRLSEPPPQESQLPPVSILKPLKGVDSEIWESFCSHCEQNYPEFQLIFGVSDPADPAIEVVGKLQAKYPNLPIELIVCDRVLGTNIKVSNLAQMLPAAHHELLLVNDSDIRVPADYLRKVIAPLADASVGLVTCLYRGVASPTPCPTLGSRLEALGIRAPSFSRKDCTSDWVQRWRFAAVTSNPSAASKRYWIIWPTTMNSAAASQRRESESNSAPRPSPPFYLPTRCGSFSAINCAGRGPLEMPVAGDTSDCFSPLACLGHS